MWKNVSILIVVASALVLGGTVWAGRDVTSPQDTVLGVPDDSDWPPNELPPFAVDDQILTKYLHFKGGMQATGIRITPVAGATVVTGLTFTTANDADGRDPVDYELSGSNESINGPYTLIASGTIDDFAGSPAWPRRTINETPIQFDNDIAYEHYQLVFPTVRTAGNYMQIAEIELLTPVFTADTPVPADGAVHADTWVNLTWTPGEAAVSHDVYFSDNRDDVAAGAPGAPGFQGNQPAANFIVGFPGFPVPEGLAPGTTYYWRVDEVDPANPDSPWAGDVWSFTVPPKTAWTPNPPNGALFVDADADLSWNPGWGAKLHTVYFGDNFDDVDTATGGTAQATTDFALDTLEAGKTYYWRVDEFDIVTTHKGDVWNFTITTGEGGLKGEYFNNVSLSGEPAFTRIDPEVNFNWGSGGPGAPLPDNGWSARWTADLITFAPDTYTFSVNSEGGTRLWIDGQKVIDVWASWVPTKYASQPMRLEAGIHTLRLEFADWDRNAQQVLSWATPTMADQIIPAGPLQPPLLAREPYPADGTVGVNLMSNLAWMAGYAAASHEVYFGTDADAVAGATKGSPEYKGSKALGEESLDAGALDYNAVYYWRVDEVNDLNPDSPWKGSVWTFGTGDFLVVDDF
ncbi:MAG: PA14 domain-containing protein, partial [Planctomycetota bacterium]